MMPLEKQVVSLELAKRLKELGVKQESYFYWCLVQTTERGDPKWKLWDEMGTQSCSAFTVAELGEMLPWNYRLPHKMLIPGGESPSNEKDREMWDGKIHGDTVIGETEADARAKMLIHLIEQGMVKP